MRINNLKITTKLISLLTAGAMVLALAGCGKDDSKYDDFGNLIITQEDNQLYDLSTIFVLTNKQKTIFVKYEDDSDTKVYDIFTGKYFKLRSTDGSNIKASYAMELGECTTYSDFGIDKTFEVKPISTYIPIINELSNGMANYQYMHAAYLRANNITDQPIAGKADEIRIDLTNAFALVSDRSVIFVKYNNDLNERTMTDVLTNAIYKLPAVGSDANKVIHLYNDYPFTLYNQEFKAKSINVYIPELALTANKNVPLSVIKEAYLKANNIPYEDIPAIEQTTALVKK